MSSSSQSLAQNASELWPGEAGALEAPLPKLTWKGTSERVTAPWVGGGAESRYRLPRVGLFEIATQMGW